MIIWRTIIDELKNRFENISKNDFEKFINDFQEDESLDFVKYITEFHKHDKKFGKIIPNFVLKKDYDHVVFVLKMNFFKKIVPTSTGVVIAGFSENNLFPSFMSFDITLNNFGHIESKLLESKDDYSSGYIIPFAQRDVIDTFLTGSSIFMKNILEYYLLQFLDDYIDLIIKNLSSNDEFDESSYISFTNELNKIKSLNKLSTERFMEFFDKFEELIMKPILVSISSMPKTELVDMAFSLINVTSIRRKMDSDVESVVGIFQLQ